MRLIILLLTLCLTADLAGQGIHFSDNRELPIQMNPAFTGILHNDYVHRVNLAHRRQGNAVLGKNEFETSYVSYDRKLGLCRGVNDMFVGVGLELLHDQVGSSLGANAQYFHRQEVNFNSSLGVNLGNTNFLVVGLRTGLLSYGLSDENLTFDSQFDGRDFDRELSTNEAFLNDRLFYFDIGAGLLFRGVRGNKVNNGSIQFNTYEIGISFMHLNNKEEKFLANSNKVDLAKEYRIHGKIEISAGDKFKINPSFIFYRYGYLFDEKGKEWQMRPSLELPFKKKWMLAGGMRLSNFADQGSNLDALVFTVKWKPYEETGSKKNRKDNMIVGVSFDMNVSSQLVRASKHYGAFEIFLTRYFTGSKNTSPCCPWKNTKNQVFY